MTDIVPLYSLLAQIRQLDFSSHSGPDSRNAWSGRGIGTVEVLSEPANHGADELVFLEQGQFTLAGQPSSVTFHNRYRWQLSPAGDALKLSHERRGRDAAVFLFDLIKDDAKGPDHFISREAHLCIDDLYAATLMIERDTEGNATGFILKWRITGPRKDESLTYHYRC